MQRASRLGKALKCFHTKTQRRELSKFFSFVFFTFIMLGTSLVHHGVQSIKNDMNVLVGCLLVSTVLVMMGMDLTGGQCLLFWR